MIYTQLLIRKAASLARRAGFTVDISDSKTTSSSYLRIGVPSKYTPKGLETLGMLRVSYHCKPGWRRGGWLKIGQGKYFDLRPRSKRYDIERVEHWIKKVVSTKLF
jgi:hypothetical protein